MVSKILAWVFLIIVTAVSLAVIMAVAGLSWGMAFMKFSHPKSISVSHESPTSISDLQIQQNGDQEFDSSKWQYYQSEDGFIIRHPGDWKAINNYVYAPGKSPYSFFLNIYSDFSSLNEYVKIRDARLGEKYYCITDFSEHNKYERRFMEYTDTCYYVPVKVFAVMYQQKVIEAVTGYMPSDDEAQIILEILSYFKFKE